MQIRTVVIIGATSGLGKELAGIYVRQGCLVGITGRRKELLEQIRLEAPLQIHTRCFDVSAPESALQLQSLVDEMGGMDLMIYNAGCGITSGTLDAQLETQTVHVNVCGLTSLAVHAFNYFAKNGKGRMAFISSVGGIRGIGRAPAYSASKAFTSVYAEALNIRAFQMKLDIVVTDVRPGFLSTKNHQHGAFWVVPVASAAKRIARAIRQKKHIVYISRRWWMIAQAMKILPFRLYSEMT